MLIKPLIKVATISSLPLSNQRKIDPNSLERIESQNYLDTYGRLLMLTILYVERSNKSNKHIHDTRNSAYCTNPYSWSLCKCDYAKFIRGDDMLLSNEQIERLSEVI